MSAPYKECPRCGTAAPLDAAFCGSCGRQYRTQFASPALVQPPAESAQAQPGTEIASAAPPQTRQPGVWPAVVLAAAVAFSSVLWLGLSRRPRAPQASGAGAPSPTASAQPAREAASPALQDPIRETARQEVEKARDEGIVPAAPPTADGRIHLRSGGTISRDEWDAAQRKVATDPLFKDRSLITP